MDAAGRAICGRHIASRRKSHRYTPITVAENTTAAEDTNCRRKKYRALSQKNTDKRMQKTPMKLPTQETS